MNKKPLVLAVSVALAAFAIQPAHAIAVQWTGTDGWWSDGTKWSNGVQPMNNDDVYIYTSAINGLTVNYENTLYPGAVLRTLSFNGPITFSQTKDSLSVSNENIYNSTFNQSGGTHNVSSNLYVNNGVYNLSGTGSFSTNRVRLDGGTINQSGGTHTVKTLYVGDDGNDYNGQNGIYNLSNGSLSSGYVQIVSSYYGPSTFTQNGGTHTVSNLSFVSAGYGGGIYNLDGGALSAGSIFGTGTLNVNGGTLSVGAGSGSITVSDLVLGKTSGANVSYSLSAAGLYDNANKVANGLSVKNLTLGDSGTGTFTQSGGTNTVAGTLTLGLNSGSSGTYNLDGGTLNVGTIVGGMGTSAFNWGAGTLNYGNLTVGNDSIFGQTFTLDASKSFSAVSLTIEANGTFNHAGGTHNVKAIGGSGTFNFNGGLLTIDGGNGHMSVGNLVLGKTSGANVSYSLSAAGLHDGANKVASGLTVSNLAIGDSGTGTFTQSGVASTLENLSINNGTYNLYGGGGSLTVNGSINNNGKFSVLGGTVFGVATFTQGSAGVLSGFGIVSTNISNAGTINAKGGNLMLTGNSFSNTGLIKNSVGSFLFIESPTVSHQGNIEVNTAGGVVFDAAITNAAGKNVALLGGTLATPTLTNQASGSVKGFGTLSGDLINAGSAEFYGPTNIIGDVTNQSGGTLLVRNDQTMITGHTVNDGTIITLQGKVVFVGGLTNNGAYLSDPSENHFTDLIVGNNG